MPEQSPAPRPELSLYDVAVIGGGAKRAVQAALATLITDGSVMRTARGYGARTRSVPTDPLEAEVHEMASRGPLVQVLFLRVEHGQAIKAIKRALLQKGCLRHSAAHLGATAASILGTQELALWRDGLSDTPSDDAPPTLAYSVALFGAEALWKTDPDMALQLGVPFNGASGPNPSSDAVSNAVIADGGGP
jgi:hypothetical protein